MYKLTLLFIFNKFIHTLLLVGGVFLKKIKKFFKYTHNDLTTLFKRGTMQSTKKLNDNFSLVFGGLCY